MLRVFVVIFETLFWLLVAAFVLALVSLATGMMTTPLLSGLGAAGFLLILPVWLRGVTVGRRRRAATILSYLEQAVRLNLPLPRMLWAAQRSERGRTARRLAQLRQRIEDGAPIGPSLELVTPEVPLRTTTLIEASERLGRMPQTLDRLVREQTIANRRDVMNIEFYRTTYPAVLILVMAGIMSFLGIFIFPKLHQIFQDHHIAVPPVTVYTLTIARLLGPAVFMLLAAWVLWFGARTLWEMAQPSRRRIAVLAALGDRIRWILPVSHALERDRGLADVCLLMAEALSAGQPPAHVLDEARELAINHVLRARVELWHELVKAGIPLGEAAKRAGLPEILSGMLAVAGSDPAAVFDFLGRYFDSRFSRYAVVVQAATVPAVVFFFAFLVGSIALSLFVPLTKLTDSMATATRMGGL